MQTGFLKIEHFLNESSLAEIESILRKFHRAWLVKYQSAHENGAINSAYITNGEFLSKEERLALLKWVGSNKVVAEARKFLGSDVRFLNTQIFFNPFNESQKNYWHRDIQYTGMPEDEQREVIDRKETQVLHLRLAIAHENGLELVPGSHFRWDSDEEYQIRMKTNGKNLSDALSVTQTIPLNRGDLLVFDANIIHRGLYGRDRFAFDILYCRPLPQILKFLDQNVLPKADELASIECPEVFKDLR